MTASLLLQMLVLLMGSVLLSVMYENIVARGEETSFSLPLANIVLVTALGGFLSHWWGWGVTVGTLAVYGAYCAIAGRMDG